MKMSAVVVAVAVAVVAVPRGMHACYVNGWQSKVQSFTCFSRFCALMLWLPPSPPPSSFQLLTHKRSRSHINRMCCVCACVSNIWMLCNCLRFTYSIHMYIFQFHMEYLSLRFCCGWHRHRHHCRCCSLVLMTLFIFISFWFAAAGALSWFHAHVSCFSHLIVGKWPCGKCIIKNLECVFFILFFSMWYVCEWFVLYNDNYTSKSNDLVFLF